MEKDKNRKEFFFEVEFEGGRMEVRFPFSVILGGWQSGRETRLDEIWDQFCLLFFFFFF